MDLLEKGKKLAQQGKFEEALDSLILAWENDKENADIHFYLGLCYSSLQQFGYARYHYELALVFNPNHPKTKLVWEGIKNESPEKPPERRLTRAAAAKARKEQAEEQNEATAEPEFDENRITLHNIKITEDKWEKAFPASALMEDKNKTSPLLLVFIILIVVAMIAALLFFLLYSFGILTI
ncbi:MAG: tetratricopeptide repeat protein [Candidatus Omnitrophota bacterium]